MSAYDSDIEGLAAVARGELVREIDAEGVWAGEPVWREAFEAVPRHLFVPYYYVAGERGYERRWGESPDRAARERWVRGAYEDVPLATRLRDGELLSSSSQPSLMARMLVELRVGDGDRVLEIGAGTGYNAALLARRLGDDDLVTTVDVEPEIVESARRHLAVAGYRPVVVTGDGARGVPERAPFDRIIATCAVPGVPRAWVGQCAEGARILTPASTGLLALTVRGGCAEGRFLPSAAFFVPLRGMGRATETVDLGGVPSRALEDELFRFLLELTQGVLTAREAYAVWVREGMPGRERYGVSVEKDREWVWLDDREGPCVWPLPV
ncbi:protein-L-isoaspartate(D-aspartate) O-methyltransferase [Streptomyces sp. Ag109_O5-1]|uniref:methyltransferase domain-containing protein n=1 Tax=Streptomyces sp. Ag109_O5-1 TaxID=1938851 RepID=UPI000F4D3C55|nr:methyltransferase domain-containing protein [Streptomyces sp. Ag109_O5-1]RPE43861.1 protein-L-isoaspartate(D-aspartate) O-methyltransferase [Streptomyces sp. Ag109_O5-1]